MQKIGQRCSVTVILTVYQRTDFLLQALESALAQTRSADEIIVADDSDSSALRAICARFADGHVRYRSNTSPSGVALNVRAAATEASGDLIAILNDDDAWEPDFLATLVPPLEEDSRRVLSFGDHWIMRADGTQDERATAENTARYGRDRLPAGEIKDTLPLVLLDNSVPLAMASVFRKDAIDWSRLVPEVRGAYDFQLSCLLARTGRPFYYTKHRISRYRLHEGMETARQAADKNENMAFILGALLKENAFPEFKTHLEHGLSVTLRTCGRDQLRFGHRAVARARFRESISIQPNAKAIAGWLLTWLPFSVPL